MTLKVFVKVDGFSSRKQVDEFLPKSPDEEFKNLKIGYNPDKTYFVEYEYNLDCDGDEDGKD